MGFGHQSQFHAKHFTKHDKHFQKLSRAIYLALMKKHGKNQAASISTRVVRSCCQFQNLMHSWLSTSYVGCDISTIYYLVVSTPLKNISQNGNLTQIGVKIKHVWNHQPNNLWWGEELYILSSVSSHLVPCLNTSSLLPRTWLLEGLRKNQRNSPGGKKMGKVDGEPKPWHHVKPCPNKFTINQSKIIYLYIP